jgi:hypothetical protein
MSTRGGGYGMDAELAAKAALKYDPQKEQEAQRWIEQVTGISFSGGSFADSLKDGQLLCILLNTIKPGTIRKVETSKMPFKQMENISNFLKACRVLGCAEHDLFETVDLFEAKDLGVVVSCIHALGRTIQSTVPTFQGPTLGPKMSSANIAKFTPSQKGVDYVGKGMTKLSMGSSQTMQRSTMNDTKDITFGNKMSGGSGSNAVSQQSQGSQNTMQRSEVSTSNSVTFGADAGTAKPPPPAPPARKWGTNTRPAPPSVPAREAAAATSSYGSGAVTTTTKTAVAGRGGGFGLDAELAAKAAAKYDVGLEQEAQRWIEQVTGISFSEGDFASSLKDGQLLCILVNTIKPGTIRKVETSKMPFKQMENISNFLKACRVLGCAEHDLFETVDLFEAKDLGVVVNCIHALGRKVQNTYSGPKLGAKESASNVRNFTEEQRKAQATHGGATLLSMGSSRTMERMKGNDTKDITFGNKAAGGAGSNVASQQSMGSQSTMERMKGNDTKDITFGNKAAGGAGSNTISKQSMGSQSTMQRSEVQKSGITFGSDASSTAATKMCRVMYDFDAPGGDELRLVTGTIVIVLDNTSDPGGWWKGQNSNGEQGVFPYNYVELI